MEHDETSLWADIKKYEDTLAKEPGSYCFAPLAELYRKLGLLDEAITVARRGCEGHPDYVGGFMALGRAYYEKGMKDESRGALEKVVGITPDNLLAQKLLSHLYLERGDIVAAGKALRLILSQSPDDAESRALLDSLKDFSPAAAQPAPVVAGEGAGEEEFFPEFAIEDADPRTEDEIDLEDAEIIEELTDEDLLEADEFIVSPAEKDDAAREGKNPLSTVTLAELYVSQGFVKRALTIYRELLETDPDNADLKKRLYQLKEAIDEDVASARQSLLAGEVTVTGSAGGADCAGSAEPPEGMPAAAVAEERVIETLEKWLDAIRRRR